MKLIRIRKVKMKRIQTDPDPKHWLLNRVPLIVFRFLMCLQIEGRAIMCIKSCLPVFPIGKQ